MLHSKFTWPARAQDVDDMFKVVKTLGNINEFDVSKKYRDSSKCVTVAQKVQFIIEYLILPKHGGAWHQYKRMMETMRVFNSDRGATPRELLELVGHKSRWGKFSRKNAKARAETGKKANDQTILKAFAVSKWPELKILFMPKDSDNALYILSIAIIANRILVSEERKPTDRALYHNAFVAMNMAQAWLNNE